MGDATVQAPIAGIAVVAIIARFVPTQDPVFADALVEASIEGLNIIAVVASLGAAWVAVPAHLIGPEVPAAIAGNTENRGKVLRLASVQGRVVLDVQFPPDAGEAAQPPQALQLGSAHDCQGTTNPAETIQPRQESQGPVLAEVNCPSNFGDALEAQKSLQSSCLNGEGAANLHARAGRYYITAGILGINNKRSQAVLIYRTAAHMGGCSVGDICRLLAWGALQVLARYHPVFVVARDFDIHSHAAGTDGQGEYNSKHNW
jgi:hypothetical protein